MLGQPTLTERRAYVRTMHQGASAALQPLTVALYGAKSEEESVPAIGGSGVLARIGPVPMILTAAHVVDISLRGGVTLYVTDGTPGAPLLPLTGCTAVTSLSPSGDQKHADDPYDLGVIQLTAELAARLAPPRGYLTLRDIDPYDPGTPGSYPFVLGFPDEAIIPNSEKCTVKSPLLPYGSSIYAGDRGAPNNYDEGIHVAMDFQSEGTIDDDGNPAKLLDPHGLSGCGIWRLHRANDPFGGWTPNRIKLIAIEQARQPEGQILKGTQVKHLLSLISSAWPGLQAAVEGQFGTGWKTPGPVLVRGTMT